MASSILVNSSIYQKLQQVASSQNLELRECLERALSEYIENYEDSKQSNLENLDTNERAFFLSLAE